MVKGRKVPHLSRKDACFTKIEEEKGKNKTGKKMTKKKCVELGKKRKGMTPSLG